jgi:hypothetical protein
VVHVPRPKITSDLTLSLALAFSSWPHLINLSDIYPFLLFSWPHLRHTPVPLMSGQEQFLFSPCFSAHLLQTHMPQAHGSPGHRTYTGISFPHKILNTNSTKYVNAHSTQLAHRTNADNNKFPTVTDEKTGNTHCWHRRELKGCSPVSSGVWTDAIEVQSSLAVDTNILKRYWSFLSHSTSKIFS